MYSLVWGKAQQLWFEDDHEYYRALGSLCRRDSYTITYETNSETESWSDAFRIKCLRSDSQTPDAFINAMRTGRRINCNDYIQNLYEFHSFDFDVGNKVLIGNHDKVRQTVPSAYLFDFEEGYNLRFTRYGKKRSNNNLGLSREQARTAAPKKTERIRHKKFGEGSVVGRKGEFIIVNFSRVGRKQLNEKMCIEKALIEFL